jgi:hypothetical protein
MGRLPVSISVGAGILVRRSELDREELAWLVERAQTFVTKRDEVEAQLAEAMEQAAEAAKEAAAASEDAEDPEEAPEAEELEPLAMGDYALALRVWPGSPLLGISLHDPRLSAEYSHAGGFWIVGALDEEIPQELSQRPGVERAWLLWHTELDVPYEHDAARAFGLGKLTWEEPSERACAYLEHAFGVGDLATFWDSPTCSIHLDQEVSDEDLAALNAARAGEAVTEHLECFTKGFPKGTGEPEPEPEPDAEPESEPQPEPESEPQVVPQVGSPVQEGESGGDAMATLIYVVVSIAVIGALMIWAAKSA